MKERYPLLISKDPTHTRPPCHRALAHSADTQAGLTSAVSFRSLGSVLPRRETSSHPRDWGGRGCRTSACSWQEGRGALGNCTDTEPHGAHACFRHTAWPGPLLVKPPPPLSLSLCKASDSLPPPLSTSTPTTKWCSE